MPRARAPLPTTAGRSPRHARLPSTRATGTRTGAACPSRLDQPGGRLQAPAIAPGPGKVQGPVCGGGARRCAPGPHRGEAAAAAPIRRSQQSPPRRGGAGPSRPGGRILGKLARDPQAVTPWRVRRWSPARVRRGPCAWGRGREPTAFIGNGSGGGDLVPEDDAVAALGQLPEENSPPRRLLACRSSSMRATGVILL